MKRIILPTILLACLSSCATRYLDNPLDKLAYKDLNKLNDRSLCENYRNKTYKISNKVIHLLKERNYTFCSDSELYCRLVLGLKFGTEAYANCIIQYENLLIQQEYQQQAALNAAFNAINSSHITTCHSYNYTGGAIDTTCY